MSILCLHSIATHKNHKNNPGRALKCAGFRASTAMASLVAILPHRRPDSTLTMSCSNTWRTVMLCSAAAGALLVGDGRSASAQTVSPGAYCSITDTIVTCTDDLLGGVFVDGGSGTYDTLNISNPAANISPGTGIAGIEFTADGNITINSNTGDFSILTEDARGIYAHTTGPGDIMIDHIGDIRTGLSDPANNDVVRGISAVTSTGDVTVTFVGDIHTDSSGTKIRKGDGIFATSGNGFVHVMATGDITTTGRASSAIYAIGNADGDVSVIHRGDIITTGVGSEGIIAKTGAGDHDLYVYHYGDITTSGGSTNHGIAAFHDQDGDVTVIQTGNINITNPVGEGSTRAGIWVSTSYNPNAPGGDIYVKQTGAITTTGDGTRGIWAESDYYLATGDIVLIQVGEISTNGTNSHGIDAESTGSYVKIEQVGTIRTAGDNSSGVKVFSDSGDITISVDNVYTGYTHPTDPSLSTGDNANGVQATSATGDITVTATGTISTLGDYADGITASTSDGGDISITGSATVSTSGTGAVGIFTVASGSGDITIDVSGAITTTGDSGDGTPFGIFAATESGAIDITALSVSTEGQYAQGIHATSESGAITTNVTGNSVTTAGDYADAIYHRTTTGAISITDAGTIATAGFASDGVDARSDSGNIDITVADVSIGNDASRGIYAITGGTGTISVTSTGTISTLGDYAYVTDEGRTIYAHGVEAISYAGAITVNVNDVTTVGFGTAGVYADSYSGDVSVTATGTISTEGDYADGVYAYGYNSDTISVSVADVTTAGEDANGVYATTGYYGSGDVSVTATGTISTQGDYADGVYAFSGYGDVTVSVNNVTTAGYYAAGVFATTGYYGSGDVSVTATGTISTAGDDAYGVYARSAYGDVTVSVNNVTTAGDYADGVFATTGYYGSGDVSVTATGTISTQGDYADGIFARSRYGDVTVSVNNVYTGNAVAGTGDDAYGVYARSYGGNVSVTAAGTISTLGDDADGVDAETDGSGTVTVNVNNVTTAGEGADGVEADSEYGAVSVTATGTITTLGDFADGVEADSDTGNITIAVNNVYTGDATAGTGEDANGVDADSDGGNVSVTATGMISTLGGSADGVKVDADGSGTITVNVNNVTTAGEGADGVEAESEYGDVSVTATGTITTLGDFADGVEADSDTGNVTVSVYNVYTGYTHATDDSLSTGDGAQGVDAATGGDGTISVTVTGIVEAVQADAVLAVTEGGAITIANSGTINIGGGFAVNASGGVVTLGNTGRINGAVQLSAFDDVLTNSGVFNAVADSDFGDGTDLFTNTNTGVTLVTGIVTFTGLEHFQNDGTISMVNGAVGDQLILPGTYDANSFLAIDINFDGAGSADVLVVAGAATGSTELVLTDVSTSPSFGIDVLVVDAGAGSEASVFTVPGAPVTAGFLAYDVVYDATGNDYYLSNAIGAPVFRMLKVMEGAQSLWYRSADAWGAHMATRRDGSAVEPSPLWMQVYVADSERNETRAFSANRVDQTVNLDYSQDYSGFQLGYEFGFGDREEDRATVFGLTGGYLSSDLDFDGNADRISFDAFNLGIYTGTERGPLYAHGLFKYDFVSADITANTTGFSAESNGEVYGARGEVGYRWQGQGFFAEPHASIEYQRASLADIVALGATVDFDRWDGLRGMAGVRVGTETGVGENGHLTVYGGGRVVREFEGEGTLNFTSGSSSQTVTNDAIDTFGRFDLGINVRTATGISGFLEANVDTGSDYDGHGGRVGFRFSF